MAKPERKREFPNEGERSEPEPAVLCACACACARCVSKIAENASGYRAFGRIRLEIGRQFY